MFVLIFLELSNFIPLYSLHDYFTIMGLEGMEVVTIV